jgi:hypothetical protein
MWNVDCGVPKKNKKLIVLVCTMDRNRRTHDGYPRRTGIIEDGFWFPIPIEETLHKTDWLIDQIVYKLYGLTEAEINIAEGRS